MARRDGASVRLITRHGNDFTDRFPFIASAVAALPARSCLIDGEAIVCDENGLVSVVTAAKRQPCSALSTCLSLTVRICDDARSRSEKTYWQNCSTIQMGIVLNKHYEEDGETVFREACRLGCEGIVSKRLGSTYRRGRSPLWLKVKNPNAPAMKREAEEDWGR